MKIRYYSLSHGNLAKLDEQNRWAEWELPLPPGSRPLGAHVYGNGVLGIVVALPPENDDEENEDNRDDK